MVTMVVFILVCTSVAMVIYAAAWALVVGAFALWNRLRRAHGGGTRT
jgi:hypothetical protein